MALIGILLDKDFYLIILDSEKFQKGYRMYPQGCGALGEENDKN